MRRYSRVLWGGMTLALLGQQATAQRPAVPATTTFTEFARDFSSIRSVRELSDRRVLVADSRERELVVLRSASDAGLRIGRAGHGPGEYQSPRALLPIGKDSTLLVDSQLARVISLFGDRIGETSAFQPSGWGLLMSRVLGSSDNGDIWGLRGFRSRAAAGGDALADEPASADSLLLLRFNVRKQALDTVRRLRGGGASSRMVKKTINGNAIWYQLVAPITLEDQVAVCGNGTLLVASASGAIELTSRDGKTTSKLSLPRPTATNTAGLRRQLIVEHFGSVLAANFAESDFPAWPAIMPAFKAGGIACVGGSHIVRLGFAVLNGSAPLDFFDFSGRLIASAVVPAGTTLVGTSASAVYLAIPDQDELQHLRMYRMPDL